MAKKSKFELEVVDNVRKIRNKSGKSQPYIAMLLEVSDGYIGQIESKNFSSMYSYDQLNLIALDLNCSPRDFFPENALSDNDFVPVRKTKTGNGKKKVVTIPPIEDSRKA